MGILKLIGGEGITMKRNIILIVSLFFLIVVFGIYGNGKYEELDKLFMARDFGRVEELSRDKLKITPSSAKVILQ